MRTTGEHPAGAGPLAPRFVAWSLEPQRSGVTTTATVTIENAGTATWRPQPDGGVRASYHWLDTLGNPIVWDGPRTDLGRPVAPGETVELRIAVTAPRPPGAYRLTFDLVEEHRFWFADVGATPLEIPVDVAPRIAARTLAVRVHGGHDAGTAAALAGQEEPIVPNESGAEVVAHLVAGALPSPEWSRLLLDDHAEGWAAVGAALVPDRRDRALAPWRGTGGRNPRLGLPLLLPSLVRGVEPGEHLGLPAYDGPDALFDGRATVTLPRRSGRRPT